MILLTIFFLLSIAFSFTCSIWEAVLLSITPAYVRRSVQAGTTTGKLLEEYKEDIDKPLSAILTLNTIAHTVGAIGVGAQAGAIFGSRFVDLGLFSLSYESIIATVMTLAILILSEIIPKTIGANNWEALTPFTVKSLQFLMFVLAPLVWLSQQITRSLKKDKSQSVLSRADFTAMAQVGEESGALGKSESMIINNLLAFERKTVRHIMTPKTVVLMGEADVSLEDFFKQNEPIPWSRIPVYDDTRDNITGIVLKDDIYRSLAHDQFQEPLRTLQRKPKFISDKTTLPELFEELTKEKNHLFIVNDEFGSIVGIVTMEDLFESLLGREIMDESDRVADLQSLAKKKWEARGTDAPKKPE